MRVLIVGGGIIGLLCAVRCARSGLQVTVLDQGPLPNASATSHDRSRVLRALHPGDADATRTSVAAHHAWSAVESLLGTRCYRTVGALSLVSPDQVGAELASLAAAGVPADGLAPAELADRYRHLMFPAGLAGVLEEHAGVLL